MNGRADKPQLGRKRVVEAIMAFTLLAVVLGGAWYLRSARFQERVRLSVIAQLEQITGGRVELKSFRWSLSNLQFEADDVTIHGLEAANAIPYAHADHLLARLKILSLLGRRIGLRYLAIDHPVFHLIAYPDGTTNQPQPKGAAAAIAARRVRPSELFDLAADQMEVRNGALLMNDRVIPLDFAVNSLRGSMTYNPLQASYDGDVKLGAMEFTYGDWRPVLSKSELHFRLWSDHAELTSLEWSSDHSRLEASGKLTNFNDPQLQIDYRGAIDLPELARTASLPELRAGRAEIAGQGSFGLRGYTLTGTLSVRGLDYRSASMRASGVALTSSYSITPERMVLSDLKGGAFGGAISGAVEIVNWNSRTTPHERSVARPADRQTLQRGSIHLRLNRVQLSALAAGISTKALPLERIHLAGTVSGTLDATWTGTRSNADLIIALDANPPAQPASDQLPLTATVRAKYTGTSGVLEIPQLNLAGRSTRFSAAGVLGSTSARLNVSLNTTDVAELAPVLEAFGHPQLPADVHGHASFNGSVVGKFRDPTISGHVQMTDFDYLAGPGPSPFVLASLPPPTPDRQPRRIHWDSLSADVQYSQRSLTLQHGVLKRGTAEIAFEGHADLAQGAFLDSSQFKAHVSMRSAQLGDLLPLAGYEYPISGKLTLDLTAGGTRLDTRGSGTLRVTDGSVYGEPFQSLAADIRLAGREAQLNNLRLTRNGATVTGMVAYTPNDEAFRIDLSGSNFELGKFSRLQKERLSIAGTANFRAQGSGTLQAPVINADLHIANLVLNGEPVGDFDATAVTHGADLRLTARSHFQSAELAVDGDVRLRGEFPADIRLRFAHLDIDPLLRAYLQGRITGHSQVAGTLDVRGPLRRPKDLTIAGEVDQFSAEIEKVKLESDGPVRFSLNNEVFTLERLHLVGDGTDIVASGTVQLGGGHELRLNADGQANLTLLRTLNGDIRSDGTMQIHMTVGGTMAQPRLAGQVRIENGNVNYADLTNGLTDINGTLVFNENRLQVQSLTATTGGGRLNLGGFITYSHGLFWNLTITSRDIRLRYPPGVSASADADLRLTGTPQNSTLAGDLTVTKFGLSPQFDLALYLARSRQVPGGAPRPDSPLYNLHLDVHIITTPELQVQTSLAKLSGNADLHLRGTAAHPVVLGRVDIAEGNISFSGTKYHVERGEITFTNPTGIMPVFNIEATARVREYDITLGFHGPSDKLTTTYRSDPPLPTRDIIALLALGRTREDTAVYQPTQSQVLRENAYNAILAEALNTAENNRMQKLFGVGRFKIDPEAGGPENNPNARVTIEQQVSDRVTLTFISNLSQSAQQIIQVEYRINRRLSVVATRDQSGVVSFDVRYRQRKR